MSDHEPDPHFILPVGTQVVCRVLARNADGRPVHPEGTAGVVVQSPADYWHSYRVRFGDGHECSFRRQEIAILSYFKGLRQEDHPLGEFNLFEHVIYRCVVGSRAYGLQQEESDVDWRGIYLPLVEEATPLARELLEMREIFLSRHPWRAAVLRRRIY